MAAFDMLSKKYPQARLVLVGPYEDSLDPVSDETRRIIKDNPAIEAVGTKRGDDLLAYYAAADCFVFPSYREGFPNTVIEAGAMGLPCIVTDINGSREIIVNGNGQRAMLAHTFRCENVNGNETLRYENVSGSVVVKDNGLIIPSKDAEALYLAMERMMTDGEMRQGMASCARQMIADRFEQGFVRRCLYDFYDEIIERER
jgi:glycosyltransferase involved in cell wall biosynthesis